MPNNRDQERRRAEQAAGAYLYELLLRRYRNVWEPLAKQVNSHISPDAVHQETVRRILVRHQWDKGIPDWGRPGDMGRPSRDRVSRAFRGDPLEPKTLHAFIDAFGIGPGDAARLWALHAGHERSPILRGRLQPSDRSGFRYQHETFILHESHYVGASGQPLKHRSMQTIRSTVDLMASYQYRYLTDADIELVVERGGRGGEPYELHHGVCAIDIEFFNPLAYGDTISLEYVTVFKSLTDYPLYFNRAVFNRVDNLEIAIVFDARNIPSRVWWTEWDDYVPEARIVSEELWRLDGNSVARNLIFVEQAVFGFRWEW